MISFRRVIDPVPEDGCEACDMNRWAYRVEFGFDGSGPWATLACSSDGCEAHQAVRPIEGEYTDAQLFEALCDFAEQDAWMVDHGAWCPTHI